MTTLSTPEEIVVRLRLAMHAAVALKPDDVFNVESLIEVGEFLVAFETLCTQIYEREISLPVSTIQDLQGLGAELGGRQELTDHLWEDAADA